MKHRIAFLALGTLLVGLSPAAVLAGQPGQSCQATPNPPGNTTSSPGSPFADGGTAGGKYANAGAPGDTNPATNIHAVSQYDVACTKNQSNRNPS